MQPPTKAQIKILTSIDLFIKRHGYCPSIKELAALNACSSDNNIVGHIKMLVIHELITKTPGASRSMVVTPDAYNYI